MMSPPEDTHDDHQSDTDHTLLDIPAAALSGIWAALPTKDQWNVWHSSRAVREVLAPQVKAVLLLTPTDRALATGKAQLPTGITARQDLSGLRLRLRRHGYAPDQQALVKRVSGEADPGGSAHVLLELLSSPLACSAAHLVMQGYWLTTRCATEWQSLPGLCKTLRQLELFGCDVDGPVFDAFTSFSSVTYLSLTRCMLMGRPAQDSLASLAHMPALTALRLHRMQGSTGSLPQLGFISSLTSLTSLTLSGLDEQSGAPKAAALVSAVSSLPSLAVLRVQGLSGIQALGHAELAPLVAGCPRLKSLMWDQHVVITGLSTLVQLTALTMLSTRSVEPLEVHAPRPQASNSAAAGSAQQDGDVFVGTEDGQPEAGEAGDEVGSTTSSEVEAGSASGVDGQAGAGSTVDSVDSSSSSSSSSSSTSSLRWSVQCLSLGGFCPSLLALAALPLQSLRAPFPVAGLSLGDAHQRGPDGMAVAVAAALDNLLLRCPTFYIPHGKLEFSGAPSAAALDLLVPGRHPPPPTYLPHTAQPLLALSPLGSRLTHLKLVDLAVGAEEMRAVAESVGPHLTALTFSSVTLVPGPEVMEVVVMHQAFSALRQVSFGRFVFGLSLHELVLALCSRQGDGAAPGIGSESNRDADTSAGSAQPSSSRSGGPTACALSELDHELLREHEPGQLTVRLVKQMCGGIAAERQGLQARDAELEAAQDMLRREGARNVLLTLSNIIL